MPTKSTPRPDSSPERSGGPKGHRGSGGSPFGPSWVVRMLKVIREDESLTGSQYATLAAATARADQYTGRVRASQELLARDAKISVKSVNRALREESVLKYFTVTRTKRYVNLDWREVDTESDSVGHGVPLGEDSEKDIESPETDILTPEWDIERPRDGHGVPPSASTSSTSSSSTSGETEKKVKFNFEKKKADITNTSSSGEAKPSAARLSLPTPVGTLEGTTLTRKQVADLLYDSSGFGGPLTRVSIDGYWCFGFHGEDPLPREDFITHLLGSPEDLRRLWDAIPEISRELFLQKIEKTKLHT